MRILKSVRSKPIIRFLAVAAVAAAAFILGGCGASLSVYAYTENGVRYNSYELTVDMDTVRKMEESAVTDAGGKKYNVPDYLYELFSGFGCELVDSGFDSDGLSVRYRRAFNAEQPKMDEPAGFVTKGYLYDIATQLDYSQSYTQNPFLRRYNRVSPDPFNGVRQAYDNITEQNQSSTVLQQLKNGRVAIDSETGERILILPAPQDAFPYLKSVDIDGLKLNYVITGSARMDSSGRMIDLGNNNGAYVFTRYFDRTDHTVELAFDRPVAYGWYLVALAAGGVTLAIFIIVTRRKKQKPTLLDRFPYNPEEYRDYDSHLPSKV